MMISTKGRYALRFMVDLAEHRGDDVITLKSVSARQDISVKYLEQIVTLLNRAGLIRSVRGNQGGYRLTRKPEEYSAGEILRVVEGSLSPVACLTENAEECERYGYCKTVNFWAGLKKVVDDYTNSVTLADLAAQRTPADGGEWYI